MAQPAPTLPAYRTDDDELLVWCVHCDKYHVHGGGPLPGAGDGHRVAHCHTKNSYRTTGYQLREVGRWAPMEHTQQWWSACGYAESGLDEIVPTMPWNQSHHDPAIGALGAHMRARRHYAFLDPYPHNLSDHAVGFDFTALTRPLLWAHRATSVTTGLAYLSIAGAPNIYDAKAFVAIGIEVLLGNDLGYHRTCEYFRRTLPHTDELT